MKPLFVPSQLSFAELMVRLRKGFTRGDMRALVVEQFRADRKHHE